ncbi:MAG: pirin family protein [Asgard group archaeon]|nr:pirin family protein [Asgard group archaeon]
MEGAGVRLKRAFGFYEVPELDPFLLLDDFHSDNPKDYIAGFPWHPHRGIETITYMLQGEVNHEDSLGNKGTIRAGEVQWMTAGSGIIHQEMPQPQKDYLAGLQLWANLPKANKMMHPRYREITKDDIIEITINDKVNVKVIAGEVNGTKGPVQDIVISPEYLDVTILPNGEFTHKVNPEHTVFAYILEGNGYFDEQKNVLLEKENLVLFEKGDSVKITSKDKHLRFILISGMPIGESIAWRGPIVMNSDHELKVAFEELQKGIFIKHK